MLTRTAPKARAQPQSSGSIATRRFLVRYFDATVGISGAHSVRSDATGAVDMTRSPQDRKQRWSTASEARPLSPRPCARFSWLVQAESPPTVRVSSVPSWIACG